MQSQESQVEQRTSTTRPSVLKGKSRVALGGVLPLVAGLVLVPQSVSAATASASPVGMLGADGLASVIEEINHTAYVEQRPSSTASLKQSVGASVDGEILQGRTVDSLLGEAQRLEGVTSAFHADGRIDVTDVSASVDSVEKGAGVRFVTLHIARTLGDGQVWEELQPFAVIDAPIGDLEPGQFFAVDAEAVQEGEVPEELLTFENVQRYEESASMSGATALKPLSRGGEALAASSTEPLSDSGPVSGVEPFALSSADRKKVKNYALKYALRPNGAFHEWSLDCTNFVSQALQAGGWNENLGWYRSDGNWWYTGNVGVRASWTWAGAANFFRFARLESGRVKAWKNVYQLRSGDILQYAQSKDHRKMKHSMVTTGRSGGVPLLSYHSTNTKNKPFTAMKTEGKTWWAHKV